MTFNKKYEAVEWFRDYKPLDYDTFKKVEMYFAKDVNFGDWVLFQHIKKEGYDKGQKRYYYTVSRPILGLCVGFSVWDMAFVINIVEQPRAWMYSHDVITNPEINYKMKVGSLDAEIENFPIWDDYIHELGHWRLKPTIGQLKECLKNNTL